jgi:hypothetical protein
MFRNYFLRPAIATALILLIPLIAMQFAAEVVWDATDFIVAGALLFLTGLAYELTLRKVGAGGLRIATIVVITAALLLVWAELAVGVFGTPWAGS